MNHTSTQLFASGPATMHTDVIVVATRATTTQGVIGMLNQIRHPIGPGWALVGDPGHHRNAITGHGITDDFRDAESLAAALDRALRGEHGEASALGSHRAGRNAQLREIFELTCQLAAFPSAERFAELTMRVGRGHRGPRQDPRRRSAHRARSGGLIGHFPPSDRTTRPRQSRPHLAPTETTPTIRTGTANTDGPAASRGDPMPIIEREPPSTRRTSPPCWRPRPRAFHRSDRDRRCLP